MWVLAIASSIAIAAAGEARAQATKVKDTEGLFLDMSKLNLGTITSEDDKKKYIYTIQLEKARVTRKTLKSVYENAFDLYRQGQYEAAGELTRKILAIDPGYEDASILNRATLDLRGATKPMASERAMLEDRFEEGMALYRQGRLVEASERWEEVAKLSPSNLKARYWLKKTRSELAAEHFNRGQKAYRQHRLREALDQWYAALVLNPKYPRLAQGIAKVEAEAREQDANEKLQSALHLYEQGLVLESLKKLDQVLESGPGNVKAQKLQAEIRAEVAGQHVSEGRRLYEQRQYDKAISEWKQAVAYGYDPKAADQLTARAKEQSRREEASRKRAAELSKQREEDAKAAAEAKEKEAAEKAAAAKTSTSTATTTASSAGTPAPAASAQAAGAPPPAAAVASENAKEQSGQAYLAGVIYYQKGDFDKAREKWLTAKQLDPSNSDAVAGLEKIERMYGTGQ